MWVNQSANRGGNVVTNNPVKRHEINEHYMLVNASGPQAAVIVAARTIPIDAIDAVDAIVNGEQYIVTYTILDLT